MEVVSYVDVWADGNWPLYVSNSWKFQMRTWVWCPLSKILAD